MGNLESSIQELIEFLKKKNNARISEATDFLGMTHKQIGPILNVLEERGIVEIKYPVIGEPQVTLKGGLPQKISITSKQMKELEESETVVEIEKSGFKDRMKSDIIKEENKAINRKIEKIENEMRDISKNVDRSLYRENLEEILLIVTGMRDLEKITTYLREVTDLIHKMKEKKVWSNEDKELVVTMLKGIAKNWREYGNEEVSKLFDDLREKIETV